MSSAFTNFLSGVFGDQGDLKDYQHASRLYVSNNYARAPKNGFLYFLDFNINLDVVIDRSWVSNNKDVGLLVKKVELPKFSVVNETVNQYNRKTVVQTGIKYLPVNIEFHDDNGDSTNNLWLNYYRHYYADSNYGTGGAITNANSSSGGQVNAFSDTKYSDTGYAYGLNNQQKAPFFKSIDIYVLHQHRFTKITLVNPLVTEWSHDSLNQDEGTKVLSNRMSIAYENVVYQSGQLVGNAQASAFTAVYYDKSPSPLSVGGNGNSTIFGQGGILQGADSVFGNLASGNWLGAAIQAKTLVKNISKVNQNSLVQEGYSIANSTLGNIQTSGNQPGGISSILNPFGTAQAQGTSGSLTNIGIQLFSNRNSSSNGPTTASPSNITGN